MTKKFKASSIFLLLFGTLLWGGVTLYLNLTLKKSFSITYDGATWKTASGGLVIDSLVPGDPVDRAGLLRTDTLLLANGVSVTSDPALQDVLDRTPAGRPATYTVRRGADLVKLEVPVYRYRSEIIWHWLLQLAGFVYIVLAVLVYAKKPESKTARTFFFFGLVAGSLVATIWVNEPSPNKYFDLFTNVWLYYNIFFINALGLDFIRRLMFFSPGQEPKKRLLLLNYLPALLGLALYLAPLVLSLAHGQFVIKAPVGFWNKIQKIIFPATYGLYLVWFFAEIATRARKKQFAINRTQGEWLRWGVGLPMALFVVLEILLPAFFKIELIKWSRVILLPPPFVFAYLILKERILDVGVVIKRSAIYAILSALLIGTFVVLVMAVSQLAVLVTGQESKLAVFASALLTAGVFNLYRQKTQNYLDRKFFKDRHNYQKALLEFSKELSWLEELETLLAKVSKQFAEALHLYTCLPFIYDQKADAYVMVAPYGLSDPALQQVCYPASRFGLATLLAQERRSLEFYALETDPLYTYLPVVEKVALKKTDTALAVPLLVKEKLVGMLHLGNKKSGDQFNSEDIDFFATLSAPLAVAVENARLYQQEVEKREMERELVVARQIQQKLVTRELPKMPGVDLAAAYLPSRQVSGDIYCILPVRENQIGLAVGDVSGKGVPASLLMATVRASLITLVEEGLPPPRMMSRLNRLVYENTEPEHFVTFFYAVYDRVTRKLSYVNAGHNPPLYFPADGQPQELSTGGLILGVLPDGHYQAGDVIVQPNSLAVFYTDGVTEAANESEAQFGTPRLIETIRHHRFLPADTLCGKILAAVREFCGDRELGDDVSLVILKTE